MIKRYLESAYMLLGEDGERVQGSQLVDGQWYAPRWGCDSLQHFIDDIKDSLIEWHDLRENPEDLPTDLTSVLVIYSPGPEIWRGREWCEGYYYRGEWAANKGPRGGKRRLYNVIKWAYIPKNNDFPDQENGEKQERR